jgi:hypothetical protein
LSAEVTHDHCFIGFFNKAIDGRIRKPAILGLINGKVQEQRLAYAGFQEACFIQTDPEVTKIINANVFDYKIIADGGIV